MVVIVPLVMQDMRSMLEHKTGCCYALAEVKSRDLLYYFFPAESHDQLSHNLYCVYCLSLSYKSIFSEP